MITLISANCGIKGSFLSLSLSLSPYHSLNWWLQIGPRMELELVKAEEGLCGGKVLYHALVSKNAEAAEQKQVAINETASAEAQRERLRVTRRNQQVCHCILIRTVAATWSVL